MKMLHENELINIEEDMILQPGHLIRSFTLHNRINGLKAVVINVGATVSSIKLDFGKDEIIRSHRDNNDDHEWQSHVLGLDTLLLNVTHSNNSTLMYQLTSDDELVMIGKFRGQQHLDLAMPFFYNLVSLLAFFFAYLIFQKLKKRFFHNLNSIDIDLNISSQFSSESR